MRCDSSSSFSFIYISLPEPTKMAFEWTNPIPFRTSSTTSSCDSNFRISPRFYFLYNFLSLLFFFSISISRLHWFFYLKIKRVHLYACFFSLLLLSISYLSSSTLLSLFSLSLSLFTIVFHITTTKIWFGFVWFHSFCVWCDVMLLNSWESNQVFLIIIAFHALSWRFIMGRGDRISDIGHSLANIDRYRQTFAYFLYLSIPMGILSICFFLNNNYKSSFFSIQYRYL